MLIPILEKRMRPKLHKRVIDPKLAKTFARMASLRHASSPKEMKTVVLELADGMCEALLPISLLDDAPNEAKVAYWLFAGLAQEGDRLTF